MTGFPPTLQAHRLEIRGGAEGTDLQIGVHRTRERCRRGLAPPATAGMLPGRHRWGARRHGGRPPPGTHAAAAGRGPPPSPLRCRGTEDPRSTVAASCGCRGDL